MLTPTFRSVLALPSVLLTGALLLAGCAKPVPTEGPEAGGGAGAEADGAPLDVSDPHAALVTAADGPWRPEKNRARNPARHPVETLEFFQIRPDMTVVELWPGGGWYTEILAPFLKEQGKLIVTNFDPNSSRGPDDYRPRVAKALLDKLAGDKARYGGVEVVTVQSPDTLVLAPENSVDLVLTFRNSHGWVNDGSAPAVYGAAFKALKPGGVLGVVQHRARPDDERDPKAIADTGYVREDYLIETIEAVGFKLDAKSEVNANPRDTKDYPKGVWTLPPGYDLGDQDRAKYEAIGESDRMTLRFVKPE